ncbi:MAG TPA: ribosome small subunit-dependent GTPase A [Thermotogota bacterium]|nr:ribosome small subunit-dependent GTPase A [Thermotogota bacterium]
MNVSDFGWNDYWKQQWQRLELPPSAEEIVGRVLRAEKGRYDVASDLGRLQVTCSGHLIYHVKEPRDLPAVGDWVLVTPIPGEQRGVIHSIFPRKTILSRSAAGFKQPQEQLLVTNVDVVWVLTALDQDFNLRRLERYLLQLKGSGAQVVIILSKADLCADAPEKAMDVRALDPTIPVVVASSVSGMGLEQLAPYCQPGQSIVLMGSSGVGKSTLVNALYEKPLLLTGEVRQRDHRGRHTTTWRETLTLPNGAVIIDTPGMRELQVWGEVSDVGVAFGDIESLAERCRFRNCTHTGEPGCAVQQAIERGELDQKRFENYLGLKAELLALQQRQKRKKESRLPPKAKKTVRQKKVRVPED